MKNFFAKLLLGAISASASLASAGWVGGGGAFLEDDNNPWFIQNTKSATYCIWVDEDNFGLSHAQLQTISADAFQFWKNQVTKLVFIDVVNTEQHKAHVEVATQDFFEVSCNANPDITLQFGVLNDDQKGKLMDPTNYAGVSVRTAYDQVALRGKGFIYLSAQNGPLKVKHSRLERPWSYHDGVLASIILTHELGHVFGFQHDEARYLTSVTIADILNFSPMHLNFIEQNFARLIAGKEYIFASDNAKTGGYSGRSNFLHRLWGTMDDETNVSVKLENSQFLVYGSVSDSREPPRLVGSATLEKREFGGNRDVGYFWFPKNQNVFPGFSMNLSTPFGSTANLAHYEGSYKSRDGTIVRTLKITSHDPCCLDVGGELDGKMFIDFWHGI